MKEGPSDSFHSQLVCMGVRRFAYARQKKCDDKVEAYLAAVNHMLKFYVANTNIAKKTSIRRQLVELANKSAVTFAGAIHLKAVKCGNAYPDRLMKKVFIDDLPLTFHSGV